MNLYEYRASTIVCSLGMISLWQSKHTYTPSVGNRQRSKFHPCTTTTLHTPPRTHALNLEWRPPKNVWFGLKTWTRHSDIPMPFEIDSQFLGAMHMHAAPEGTQHTQRHSTSTRKYRVGGLRLSNKGMLFLLAEGTKPHLASRMVVKRTLLRWYYFC